MKPLKQIILAILMTITVFACSVLGLWSGFGDRIDQFDSWLIETYISSYEEQLSEAVSAAASGDQGLRLRELRADLSSIKRMDRLARLKRQVYTELIKDCMREKRYDEAIEHVDAWISFDERDLTAKVSKAQVLFQSPVRRTDGITLLNELYRDYPDVKMIASSYEQMVKLL